jgi:3',5'-cyclic AMP phosphodiesterase CpdA
MMTTLVKVRWFWMVVFCFAAVTAYCDSSFISDVKSGPYPWTHTRFSETGNDFHFAVVSDRNGGCRTGIFELAVEKLNLLRPALVMSVGDYIGGYIDNVDSLRDQVTEVDGILQGLEPPFFFVPGNHDYCCFGLPQPVLDATAKVWKERRGPTYYSFIYKNTLFLCLNSMGGENHRWGLGESQFAWVKDVLAKHSNVRWTFIFMHNPLWEEKGKGVEVPSRFSELEKVLKGRNYTFFTGHWHEYSRYERQGMKYFVLSTTGGGSAVSGPEWGEFDHIMWVSMTDSGPRFSNLALNGIYNDDVCTEEALKFKGSIKFAPANDGDGKKDGHFSFSFKNTFNTPMNVTLTWTNRANYSIEPEEKSDIVAPGAMYSLPVHIQVNDGKAITIPKLTCRFNAGKFKANRDYTPSFRCLDGAWKEKMNRTVVRTDHAPKIDGKLDDGVWQRSATVDGFALYDLSEMATPKTQTWLAYDDQNLYVAWRCAESDMKNLVAKINKRDGTVWTDDSVEFFLDTKLNRTSYYHFALNSLGTIYDNLVGVGESNFSSNAQVAASRCEDCWMVELAVSWKDMNVQSPVEGTKMGYEFVRERPRTEAGEQILSQFPPLGSPSNHQPELFGVLIFGK